MGSSRRQRFRRNTCRDDYIYDSASHRCYACSEICLVPDYFCRSKCPGYYYRNIPTAATNYASVVSLPPNRMPVVTEQSLLYKPLFWASMACFFVTMASTVGIIVICSMHWRKFIFCFRQSRCSGRLTGRPSSTSGVDKSKTSDKKDPPSESKGFLSFKTTQAPSSYCEANDKMLPGLPPLGYGCFRDGGNNALEPTSIFLVADDDYLPSYNSTISRAHPDSNAERLSLRRNADQVQVYPFKQIDCEQPMGFYPTSTDHLVVNIRLRADDEESMDLPDTSVQRLSVVSIGLDKMNPSLRSSSESFYSGHFTLTDTPLVHVPGSRLRVSPSQCKEVYMPINLHSAYRMS